MTRHTQQGSIKWVRMLVICAPAALLGACAPPPPPNVTAEQALTTANRAEATATEALNAAHRAEAMAQSSRTQSSEMYQRTLRK
jgi:cell division septation protein DedD